MGTSGREQPRAKKKRTQQTLEAAIGRTAKTRTEKVVDLGENQPSATATKPLADDQRVAAPMSSSARQRQRMQDISSDSEGDADDLLNASPKSPPQFPRRGTRRDSHQSNMSVASNSSPVNVNSSSQVHTSLPAICEDNDRNSGDSPLAAPVSSNRRAYTCGKRLITDDAEDRCDVCDGNGNGGQSRHNGGKYDGDVIGGNKGGGDDDDDDGVDDDDNDIVSASTKRRRLVRRRAPESESETEDKQVTGTPSAVGNPRRPRRVRSGARSEKQKQRELLRRRRRGDKVEEDQLTSSSEGGHIGLYDTDPEHPALDEFEDDEQEDQDGGGERPSAGKGSNLKTIAAKMSKEGEGAAGEHNGSDDSMESFIADDDDGPIGCPPSELFDIPLEFTAQSHKPMKVYFKDALEWLVQCRINPSFERNDPVYRMAWRKLDDEVSGLAQSKFTSASWSSEFHESLRAHPHIDNFPVQSSGGFLLDRCQACNRGNHPATRRVRFSGQPYHKGTLEDLETDSDSDDHDRNSDKDGNGDGDGGGGRSKDGGGWLVGVVCASNAETAHTLYHWKHHLKEWAGDHLEAMGLFTPEKLEKRERLSSKKRHRLAIKIIDDWEEKGTVKALYGDFKRTLEDARNKSTAGRKGRR